MSEQNILQTSWFMKHQPKVLSDYVFDDPVHESQVKEWIIAGSIPGNLLLSGPGGCGKSSLAALLINEFVKSQSDYKKIKSRSVAEIDELESFVRARPVKSKKKIVLFEEMDKLSSTALTTLKDGVLENFQQYATFIGTTNYANKLDHPLKTRFIHLSFEGSNIDGIIARCKNILILENIIFNEEDLKAFVNKKSKIGMRNLITLLQVNSVNNKIDFTNINVDITTSEDSIVTNTLKIFEILLNSDAQNKRLILLNPLSSSIQPQYAHILEIVQFSNDLSWEEIYIQISEKVHFLPIKSLCSKYVEDVANKKMPSMQFLSFLYETIKTILDIY
jgi:DNA polymerase III delta prime subunit